MTTLHEFQRGMLNALLADAGDFKEADFDPGAVSVAAGAAVYRNNVFAKLTEALGDLYPVVKRLVGDGFFAYAANEFVHHHPPRTPVLVDYGDGFPDFLDSFKPAETVPYLSSVARYELARHQALNAADATPLTADALKGIKPERFGDLCLTLHPSCRLLRSAFPVEAIWVAHQDGGEPDGSLEFPAHEPCLLVARPEMSIKTMVLSIQAFDLVTSIKAGAPLAGAFEATGADWDPEQALTDMLIFGTFVDFNLSQEKLS